ncbi:MAG: BsuPI-related putative proteinase inhibitor [Verrucomicrobia bacterium]|jgi:hypothetical protein|nr:BsuPI-related putative proteinase inhibitor [Verrucomicrobiota bacterium]MDA1202725.1 BsuPI-related putative proteinase inhibitor [Verrucomicrobiota bacterium]
MRSAGLAIIFVAALAACVPSKKEGTAGAASAAGIPLRPSLRAEPGEFRLSRHREVRVVFSLVNISRRVLVLDFPTEQHFEVAMRTSGGQRLFLWSEDRHFAAAASSVVINPGERLEYEADVPTREMEVGGIYPVEAFLLGYPETTSTIMLSP